MIYQGTVNYTDYNGATNNQAFPIGLDLQPNGIISFVAIDVITPFTASDGSQFNLSLGISTFTQKYIFADGTIVTLYQTSGLGDQFNLNDIDFVESTTGTTEITSGIFGDFTTPLTQGSFNYLIQIEDLNPIVDWNLNSGEENSILNKPTLSTVATSGDYSDLINKPTITIIDAGKVTLSSGVFTVSETDILTTDIIQVTLQDISVDSGSSHIFSYSGNNIIENTSFDISSISYSTDGAIDTGDSSVVSYTITRKS